MRRTYRLKEFILPKDGKNTPISGDLIVDDDRSFVKIGQSESLIQFYVGGKIDVQRDGWAIWLVSLVDGANLESLDYDGQIKIAGFEVDFESVLVVVGPQGGSLRISNESGDDYQLAMNVRLVEEVQGNSLTEADLAEDEDLLSGPDDSWDFLNPNVQILDEAFDPEKGESSD